jgi:hypothetical protein
MNEKKLYFFHVKHIWHIFEINVSLQKIYLKSYLVLENPTWKLMHSPEKIFVFYHYSKNIECIIIMKGFDVVFKTQSRCIIFKLLF